MHYENNRKVVRAGYAPIEEEQNGTNVQPQQAVQETPDPEPEYEINVKIHCTNEELNSLQTGQWSLGRTELEAPVSQWGKEETPEKESVLTAHCFQNEEKVLHHELFAKHHTTCFDVIPKPKGTKHINAEFIPVKLAIKANESKLAFPTEGYFYHFVSGKLSREYCIAGEGRSTFQATLSEASKLNDDLLSPNQLTSVLLPYKREDAPAPDQHFLYRLEKFSQDQLDAVTTQWLDEHALKLEMDDIVAVRTSALEERPEAEQGAEVWPPLKQFKAVHPFGDIWGQFKQHKLSETMVNVMQSHSIPDKVPVLILPVTKEEQLTETVLDIFSKVAGVGIGKSKSKSIPQTIHRFWSGGAMSQEALHVLTDSIDKSEGSQFKHCIWHSSSLEQELKKRDLIQVEVIDTRETQRVVLRSYGYDTCDIDELFEPDPTQSTFDRLRKKPLPKPKPGVLTKSELLKMVKAACDHLQKGGSDKWDGIKHFSDISRLIYLKEKGGHHFDVDFGLGNMNFEQSYYHNDEGGTVPLMGATTSVSRDRINEHLQVVHPSKPQDLSAQSYRDSVVQVAEQAMMMSGMLNGIIATSAQNPNVVEGIETLRTYVRSGDLSSGMVANRKLLGDTPNGSAYTIPPYLIDLEHITAESDSR